MITSNLKKSRKAILTAALLVLGLCAYAQQLAVKGSVLDEAGEPIIGAYITLQGNNNVGTITDFDGNFEISVDAKSKLLVSYTGYESQTIAVAGKSQIDVVLREIATHLDEVVAIGYGSQKAKEITSSVASVKSENFNPGVKESPMGLLQGKVAGLTVTRTEGGDPTKTGFNVQIRGTSTLDKGSGTTPLYIVDGIPVTSIDNIAPEEIASMDVLKDGSSAAIYGTRGTNGVIMITTKRGAGSGNVAECGTTSVEYAGYASFAIDASKQQMATADQFLDMANMTNNKCKPSDKGYKTDWVREQMRDFALTHNHNLAISGATKNFSYRGSVNFKNAEGIANTSNRQEIMAKLAANQKALQGWLDLQYDFSYMHYKNDYFCGSFDNGAIMNPTMPIYNEDGSYYIPTGTVTSNPIADNNLKEAYQDGNYFRGSIKASVNIKPVPGLKINGFAAFEEGDNYDYWSNSKKYYQASGANLAGRKTNRSMNQLYEGTIDYANEWNGHALATVLGTSYQNFWYDGSDISNGGFAVDGIKYFNIGAGDVEKTNMLMSSYRNSNTLMSFFARANYNYKEKYLLSASIRCEGSSRMGANNKWGWFPAASAGWRVSGEDFLKDVREVNDLKLRFGFGITGNNLGSDLKSVELLTQGGTFNNHGTQAYSYTVNQNANANLAWERKFEYNLGIDYAFFDSRLYGSIDLYYRNTKDLLWEYNVPTPPYQYSTLLANAGEMISKGIEIAITGVPVKTKNWNWTTSATIALNNNTIVKLSDPELGFNYETTWAGQVSGNKLNGSKTQLLTEGQSVGTFYGYKWTGKINPNGSLEYEDVNNDGVIDDLDKQVVGYAQPKFTYGWNNTLRYKNWDLSLFFRGVVGNDVLNVTRWAYAPSKGSNGLNVFYAEVQGIENGTRTFFQSDFSDYYLEDGSYLKLDNITLGYKVPLKPNKYCQYLRFYFTAQNVFTITNYSGIDPEVNTTSVWDPGLDYIGFYPTVGSFLIGANVTF